MIPKYNKNKNHQHYYHHNNHNNNINKYFRSIKHQFKILRKRDNEMKKSNEKAIYPLASNLGVEMHAIFKYPTSSSEESYYISNNTFTAITNLTYNDVGRLIYRFEYTMKRIDRNNMSAILVYEFFSDKSGMYNTEFTLEWLKEFGVKCHNIPNKFLSVTYLKTCEDSEEFVINLLTLISYIGSTYRLAKLEESSNIAYLIDEYNNILNKYEWELKPFEEVEKNTPGIDEVKIKELENVKNIIIPNPHHNHHHGYLRKDKSLKLLYRYFKGLKERPSNLHKRNSNEKALYPIPSNLGAELHNIIDDEEVYTLESFYESNNTFVGVGNISLKGVDKLIFRYEYDMIRKDSNNNSLISVKRLRDSRSGMYVTDYIVNYLNNVGCKNVPVGFINMLYLESCKEASDMLRTMEVSISILSTDYLEALKVEGSKNAYYVDDLGNICEDYKVFDLKPFDEIDKDIPDIQNIF